MIPEGFGQNYRLSKIYLQSNKFNGTLDAIFCQQGLSPSLQDLQADCKGSTPEIECTCCTICCNFDGTECSSPTSVPVATSTLPPGLGQARFDELVPILQPVSGLSHFSDTSSPQYKAAWWLATTDGAQLDFATEAGEKIIQRYVLALLWYALGGEGWESKKKYVTEISTCSWDDIVCDDDGLVIEIDLRENNLIGWIPSEIGSFPYLQTLVLGTFMCVSLPVDVGTIQQIAHSFSNFAFFARRQWRHRQYSFHIVPNDPASDVVVV